MTWLGAAYFSAYYLLAFGFAVGLVFWAMLGAKKPFWPMMGYWLCVFYFPNASWGIVGGDGTSNFYNRGTGTFLGFSAINVYLFGMAAAVMVARLLKTVQPAKHNLGVFLWGFGLIFLFNIPIGLWLDYPFLRLVGGAGLLHVLNMILAIYIMVAILQTEKDLEWFINTFLFAAFTRALWGIARYVALGGDPANFYANFQKIDVKITFFDINDGLIATVAAFILGWRLLHGAANHSLRTRIFYGFFLMIELFIVVFSFRRSGWLGFGLAAVLFALVQRAGVRNLLLIGYAAAGAPLLVYQAFKRMASSSLMAGAGFFEKLAPDIFASGKVTADSGRFVELDAAWRSISESPVFGLGIWGEYRGFGIPELAFHRGDYSWMHSGVLHIWLKAGFVGVTLLLGLWFCYIKFVYQHAPKASVEYRGVMLAGLAGFLFMLPTWMVGTPVIEYRTMQLAALLFALPYAVYAIDQRRRLAV